MPARSKVAMLPADVRTELERRIMEGAFSGYHDLAEWLDAQGYHIAHDSVQRHGSWLRQNIEAMERLAEDAQAIAAVAAQASDTIVDVTIQLIHHRVLSMLLEEPDSLEEASSTALPTGAPCPDSGRAALTIRDLVRLTRIVTDLNRVTIARQRQAENARSLREQQKRADGKRRSETEGGLSEEVYQAILNTLLGINPFAPDPKRREESSSAGVPACGHYLEGPSEETNEASQTHLDADRRTSTPTTCSNAPPIEAGPSDERRCCGFVRAVGEPPLQELTPVNASSSLTLRSSRAPP